MQSINSAAVDEVADQSTFLNKLIDLAEFEADLTCCGVVSFNEFSEVSHDFLIRTFRAIRSNDFTVRCRYHQ